MIKEQEYFTEADILISPNKATRIGCVVSKTGVTANDNGEYVVKAGTPLYGTDVGMNRETALTIAATGVTGSETKPQGILYKNVPFESGETTANGVLVIDGTVDYLKLDSTVQTLITTTVKTALPTIHFVKGRKD